VKGNESVAAAIVKAASTSVGTLIPRLFTAEASVGERQRCEDSCVDASGRATGIVAVWQGECAEQASCMASGELVRPWFPLFLQFFLA
jgi:hypothetical protein